MRRVPGRPGKGGRRPDVADDERLRDALAHTYADGRARPGSTRNG
jgi:hypothetical protein